MAFEVLGLNVRRHLSIFGEGACCMLAWGGNPRLCVEAEVLSTAKRV